ncbi:hypothetical protein TVAG_437470 [Trichomonas vaginalis G3]|uniref:Uncharacterized protein n=1 Tax=Trichomonas vaginalis (strain ATCC PRA-98 / G3) TaxID=412133 RepID=A2DFJ3_TRIV3|nr:hypothetical protein TVAGG3_0564580 [Trichomonas vaginalis G3]EAY20921.1 hypothetical protein TVAG_437470 [Trichomonas vaginalis G3]KAI5521468.1 hypothetical protein TVAGG3_0564580 [Trichomonas vaginalis G3]|eukprot:XP_001581907.1 hypothetical protein [Trichomonas vaginalis G3]
MSAEGHGYNVEELFKNLSEKECISVMVAIAVNMLEGTGYCYFSTIKDFQDAMNSGHMGIPVPFVDPFYEFLTDAIKNQNGPEFKQII